MCWEINKKKFNKKPEKYHKVAKKDIEVYKIGCCADNGFSPYYHNDFSYKSNIPNKEIKLYMESSQLYKFYAFINEGYHSYSGECFIQLFRKNNVCVGVLGIYAHHNGKFFSYGCVIDYMKKGDYKLPSIGKFIIPKGSEYYENEDGEIVSSQLIYSGKNILIIGWDSFPYSMCYHSEYVNEPSLLNHKQEIKQLKNICVGE